MAKVTHRDSIDCVTLKIDGVLCIDSDLNLIGNSSEIQLRYPYGHLNGFNLSEPNASTVKLGEGYCRDSQDMYNIINETEHTISALVSGSNGMSPGETLISGKWLAVYIIGDSRGVSSPVGLLSHLYPNPFSLPNGYNVYRRVSWVYNTSDDLFRKFNSFGSYCKNIIYDEERQDLEVLTGGIATAWTSIDISEYVPPGTLKCILNCSIETRDSGDFVSFRPGNFNYGTDPFQGPAIGGTPSEGEALEAPLIIKPGYITYNGVDPYALYTVTNEIGILGDAIEYVIYPQGTVGSISVMIIGYTEDNRLLF